MFSNFMLKQFRKEIKLFPFKTTFIEAPELESGVFVPKCQSSRSKKLEMVFRKLDFVTLVDEVNK
jgi:hypothetical protein